GGQVRRELVLPRRSEVPGKAPQPLPVAVELEVRPAVLHPLAVDRVARGQEVELRDRLARASPREQLRDRPRLRRHRPGDPGVEARGAVVAAGEVGGVGDERAVAQPARAVLREAGGRRVRAVRQLGGEERRQVAVRGVHRRAVLPRRHHPLTPEPATPSMTQRWTRRKTRIVGTVAITVPAITMFHWVCPGYMPWSV